MKKTLAVLATVAAVGATTVTATAPAEGIFPRHWGPVSPLVWPQVRSRPVQPAPTAITVPATATMDTARATTDMDTVLTMDIDRPITGRPTMDPATPIMAGHTGAIAIGIPATTGTKPSD